MKSNAINDGSGFEGLISAASNQYERRGVAFIKKTPNPWKVISRGNQIVKAFPSTENKLVDFMGVADGRAIHFEAKSTSEVNRFDLSMLTDDQYEFLKKSYDHGAHTFVLIEFVKRFEVWCLPFSILDMFWRAALQGGRKSIPYDTVADLGYRVRQSRGFVLDYLPHIPTLEERSAQEFEKEKAKMMRARRELERTREQLDSMGL